MNLSKTTLIQIIIIVTIVGGYFLIDFNALMKKIQGEGQFVTQNVQCDLHKTPCNITLPSGNTITFEIFPKSIPLMEKLTFKATTQTTSTDTMDLKIYATNMFMGEFAFVLKKQADNSYIASGTLPTCPIGNMQWNADISSATFKTGARFQFQTDK